MNADLDSLPGILDTGASPPVHSRRQQSGFDEWAQWRDPRGPRFADSSILPAFIPNPAASLEDQANIRAAIALIRIEEGLDTAAPVIDRQLWLRTVGQRPSPLAKAVTFSGMDPDTVEYLARVLTDGSEGLRRRAAEVFDTLQGGSILASDDLRSPDRTRRVAAAAALRQRFTR